MRDPDDVFEAKTEKSPSTAGADSSRNLVITAIVAALASVVLVVVVLLLRSGGPTIPEHGLPHEDRLHTGTKTEEEGARPAPQLTEQELERSYRRLLAEGGWKAAQPEKNAAGLWRAIHEKTGLTFVLIPPGSLTMGSPKDDEHRDDDESLRSVSIRKPFLLCETECTQDAWDRVGGDDHRRVTGGSLPIVGVSWYDAKEWCEKAGLRLPTEAEWEYACRAGERTRYSFGDDHSKLEEYGWYLGNSANGPEQVATLKPNPWGLYDMHGNVREWTEDIYHEDDDGETPHSGASSYRVLRGGSFSGEARWARSASRVRFDPGLRQPDTSFRPARDAP